MRLAVCRGYTSGKHYRYRRKTAFLSAASGKESASTRGARRFGSVSTGRLRELGLLAWPKWPIELGAWSIFPVQRLQSRSGDSRSSARRLLKRSGTSGTIVRRLPGHHYFFRPAVQGLRTRREKIRWPVQPLRGPSRNPKAAVQGLRGRMRILRTAVQGLRGGPGDFRSAVYRPHERADGLGKTGEQSLDRWDDFVGRLMLG